jgi:hypothetical protein
VIRPVRSHPFWAGYRKPSRRQNLILVLSALAGCTVAGIYLWAVLLRPEVPALPAQGEVVHSSPDPEVITGVVVCSLLFFGTTYATGMALYRYFGDAEGYLVVSANAGQHMPLVFLMAGGALAGPHGMKIHGGSGRGVDWLMLAIGLGLLAISVCGLYRAIVVHRKFYQWFYGLRQDRPTGKP